MATGKTGIWIILDGFTLSGGQTHHWKWNNSRKDATHAFQVQPFNSQNNSSLEYRSKVHDVRSLLRGGNELEIYFNVTNWGSSWHDYRVHMSRVRYS